MVHNYTQSRGKILYMKIQKVLYGMLKSAKLFNQKLWDDLESNRFPINPYDPCVANKMIDGEQMTIIWYVDDLKVSHKIPWAHKNCHVVIIILWGDQSAAG